MVHPGHAPVLPAKIHKQLHRMLHTPGVGPLVLRDDEFVFIGEEFVQVDLNRRNWLQWYCRAHSSHSLLLLVVS